LFLSIHWAGDAQPARADVLELKNGGRIQGQLITAANDNGDYVIETATGRVTIARDQVARVDATSEVEKEYAAAARNSPDTIEAHWKLYEWCRDHKLREQAQTHLTRLLELDPDHAQARSILGFQMRGGQWQTRDELMASRGMVKFEGEWYTRQHVELLQQKKETKSAQVDWRKDLARLRRWLVGSDQNRSRQARTEIQAIRDPLAAEPLVTLLRTESIPALRRLWLETLAPLDHPSVPIALVEHSLLDANDEMRHQCLEYQVASGRPGLIAPYLRALQSDDNVTINRAAVALGMIADPDAVPPLVEVLITNHRIKISDNTGQMRVSNSPGSSGIGMGGGPKYENRVARNADVLAALISLTNMAQFQYDQPAWRAWLAARAKSHPVDLRRDL
jgi:hypothetical protein